MLPDETRGFQVRIDSLDYRSLTQILYRGKLITLQTADKKNQSSRSSP